MKNPQLTVTIYPRCTLTGDEIAAVHDAAIAALPARSDVSVSAARLADLSLAWCSRLNAPATECDLDGCTHYLREADTPPPTRKDGP